MKDHGKCWRWSQCQYWGWWHVCTKIIGKSHREVGGWIFSKEVCAVPNTHSSPLLSPFSSLPLLGIALRQINGLVLNKSFLLLSWWQSTILLSLYLFVSISSKSAGCPYKARGKTRQARDKRGRAKGGQEGARGRAGQTEVSFPKISSQGAVLVWGLR